MLMQCSVNLCNLPGLEVDEIKCLKNCFDLFDSKKQDFLSADDLDEIWALVMQRNSPPEDVTTGRTMCVTMCDFSTSVLESNTAEGGLITRKNFTARWLFS